MGKTRKDSQKFFSDKEKKGNKKKANKQKKEKQ